ncbi:MAG: MAPEG family protein [Hyphomonadaceae bacterium]|nr:MAPEG family protein [Hyphomonadaceae bacterium]
MCALAGLTFFVLLLVPILRFIAAARREVTANDFALGESDRVPDRVRLPNRNLANLLETPVLFYVLCLALIVADALTPMQVHLAWVYVGLRVLHSLVHVTFNYVPLRLVAFASSVVVLNAMWVLFAMKLLGV